MERKTEVSVDRGKKQTAAPSKTQWKSHTMKIMLNTVCTFSLAFSISIFFPHLYLNSMETLCRLNIFKLEQNKLRKHQKHIFHHSWIEMFGNGMLEDAGLNGLTTFLLSMQVLIRCLWPHQRQGTKSDAFRSLIPLKWTSKWTQF